MALMLTGKISFSTSVDLDGDCTLIIEVESQNIKTHSSFWVSRDALVCFATELTAFPKTVMHSVRFEEGKPEYQHYNYLMLEAYCYSPAGHSAIKILAYNGEPEPYSQRVEFSIPAEAASINKLGNLLRDWNSNANSFLQWEAQAS